MMLWVYELKFGCLNVKASLRYNLTSCLIVLTVVIGGDELLQETKTDDKFIKAFVSVIHVKQSRRKKTP